MFQSQSGITLIILLVTIVVILILAGITYNLAWGNNGIIKRALGLQQILNDATRKEEDTLQDVESQINKLLSNAGIEGGNTSTEQPPEGTPASPSITVNGAKGEDGCYASDVEVIFHKKDPSDRMTYKVEGTTEETTIQNGESISFTEDGRYTITAYAYNDKNQPSIPTTVTITKDTVAPIVTLSFVKYEATGVQVQAVAEDPSPASDISTTQAYTFYYQEVDTTEWVKEASSNASSYTYTNLQPGVTYRLKATVTDKAGNVGTSNSIENIQITTDTTKPTIQDIQLPEGAQPIHKEDSIEVILNPNEEVTVDATKFIPVDETGTPIDATVQVTKDEEGKIHVMITAGEEEGIIHLQIQPGAITDIAGNTNEEQTIATNTKIDTTRPEIQKTDVGEPQVIKKGEKVTIVLMPSEEVTVDISKIVLSGEGATGASKTVTVESNGSITINITGGTGTGDIDVIIQPGAITDIAGNTNNETTFTKVAMSDNMGPNVNASVQSFTTHSITVQTVAVDIGEAGLAQTNTYTYTLSTNEAFNTDVQTKQTTDTFVSFEGLKDNTTYYIKVVVADKKENKTTSNTVIQTTGRVPEGESNIEFGTTNWENETASIQVQKGSTVADDIFLEYEIMQGSIVIQDWKTAPENPTMITELLHDYTIIARLVDKEGNTHGSKSFTIRDNIAPIVILTEQSAITNGTVTITAIITEQESGIAMQKYAQGMQTETYFQTAGTEFEGTTFEATENGIWTAYIQDKAGNETIQTITVTKRDTTKPDFSQIQVPTDIPVVKNGETLVITVTPSKEVTIDTTKFRVVDSEGNQADSTIVVNQTDGKVTITITAGTQDGDIRLQVDKGAMTDVAGNQNDERTITTNTKIDNTKPVITLTKPADKTVIGPRETTTMELIASEEIEIHPENIILTGTGSTGATITTTKENGKILLTIAGGTTTGTIDVEIGAGAFTDIVGNASEAQTLTSVVQNDASAPSITDFAVTDRTTSTIQVSVTAADVGLAGISEEGAYTYIISTDLNFIQDVTWEFPANSAIFQFTSLQNDTTYYIKMNVKDAKGNTATSEVLTVTTTAIPSAIENVTFSDVTWSDHAGNVTITADETATVGYTLQYKITDATGVTTIDWTDGEGKTIALTGIANESTLHARLWDGNAGGNEKEKLVQDEKGPEFTKANVDLNTPEGYGAIVNIGANDENGLSETEPYAIYYRKSTETDFTRYVTQTSQTSITALLEPATTYIIYMEATDYFGNPSHTTEVEITNADAVAQIDTTIYGTLQKAMNAVPEGTTKTITMLKSVSQNGKFTGNKTAILNLNQTTLNGQVSSDGNLTIQNGKIAPTESSTVHVYDTGVVNLESTLSLTSTGDYPTVTNFGTVNVNGATVNSSKNALINYADATMNVNSGTIQTSGSNIVTVQNNGTLNVKGGTIGTGTGGVGISNTNILNMTGGTLEGLKGNGLNTGTSAITKITGGSLQGGTEYPLIVNENELTIDGGSVTLTGGSNLINNKSAAVAYLKSGSFHETGNSNTIYNLGTVYVSGGNYVADNNLLFANEGTLNVTGGTLNGSGGTVIHNLETGTANISGGKITSTKSGTQAVLNYGKTTISGSADISGNTSLIVNYSETAQIDVTGGTIAATGSNNAFHNLGIVNFSGATLTSEKSTALSSEKTLNIKGGNITSDYGNAVYTATSGTTTITGGTLKTTDDFPVIANYGRTDVTNSAVKVTGTGNGIKNNSGGTVNVSAGTISTTATNVIYNIGTMTISGSADISGNGGATIYNTGTLTTKGSMKVNSAAADALNEGTWNMQGGTITCTSTSVYGIVNSATFNMSAGTIKGSVVPVMNQYKFNLSGGTINCTSTGQGFQNNQGGTLEFTGGTIIAQSTQPLIGNNGTVNVRTNITRAESITTNAASGVFNLISGTMTCSGSSYYPFYNQGTLELKGSKINCTGITPIGNLATFNASSGSITVSGDSAGAVLNAGTMTTSGSVTMTSAANTVYNNGGTVKVNGGTITATGDGYPTLYLNGGTGTQTAGTITHSLSSTNYAVYKANGATFNKTGGTVGIVGP